jgi:hypothetical protein
LRANSPTSTNSPRKVLFPDRAPSTIWLAHRHQTQLWSVA